MDMRIRWKHLILGVLLVSPPAVRGQSPDERIDALEARLDAVERTTSSVESGVGNLQRRTEELAEALARASAIGLLLLTGTFCALWAQNTKRNPWVWFFLGFFFHFFTLFFLLLKNARDRYAGAPVA
jgi:hypothetical protein